MLLRQEGMGQGELLKSAECILRPRLSTVLRLLSPSAPHPSRPHHPSQPVGLAIQQTAQCSISRLRSLNYAATARMEALITYSLNRIRFGKKEGKWAKTNEEAGGQKILYSLPSILLPNFLSPIGTLRRKPNQPQNDPHNYEYSHHMTSHLYCEPESCPGAKVRPCSRLLRSPLIG
jgi:hypothetical protein